MLTPIFEFGTAGKRGGLYMWNNLKSPSHARLRKSSVDRTVPRSRNQGFMRRHVTSLFDWRVFRVSDRHRRSLSNGSLPLYASGGLVKPHRKNVLFVVVLGFLLVSGLYFFRCSSFIQPGDYPLPPLYRYYHEQDVALPQHDPTLPYPEGSNAKFLWLPNHVHSKQSLRNFQFRESESM